MHKKYILPLVALPLITACKNSEQQATPPNIVLIYADDIGFGDLGWNGATTISTPNIEQLAQEGIRFTNAHSTAATSTPSRYAMLTGEYAWRKEGTGIADGNAGMIIRPDRYTLADMLKEAGYQTAVVGKWHLGLGNETGKQDWNKKLIPGTNDIGFDYSYIMAATGDRVPCVYVENDLVVGLDPQDPLEVSYKQNFEGEPTGRDNPELLVMHPSHGHDQTIVNGISRIGYMKGGHAARWKDEEIAEVLTAKAVQYIKENKDRPFFLYFATQDAHVPRVPSPRFKGKSGMGPRGDVLLQFDWSVGEVMKTLKDLGLDEKTLVILSSDNGPVLDDGYVDYAEELLGEHKPAGDFRGGKYSSYEAATRVPCIVRWKGNVKPSVQDQLMCQIDWFASFASLVNIELPQGVAPDSQNHLDAWLGLSSKGRDCIVVQNLQNNLALISGNWKYIKPGKGPAVNTNTNIELGNSPDPQLYNLETDIREQQNLASEYPEKVKQLQLKLENIIASKP